MSCPLPPLLAPTSPTGTTTTNAKTQIWAAVLAALMVPPAAVASRLPRAATGTTVAVVEFVAVDASAAPDAEALRARLAASGMRAEAWLAADFAATGRYVPVPAPRVAAALASLGTTPGDCDDVACAVRLGRALGVERVVTGRVSKLSNLIWFLYATMVDVPAGRALQREEFEVKGNITDLLPRAMLALSRRLVAHDSAGAAPADGDPPAPRQGEHLTRDQVLAALAAATPEHPANFVGKDLSGLDLSGVDFKRADLSRSRLVRTNLARAHLFSTTLTDAVATGADFTGANLDVSVMYRVDLRHATLREASLFAAILTGADLSDADLTRARVIAVLGHAKLVRAQLTGANLGADPGNQPMGLMRTDAADTDCTDADFTGANLRKMNLTRAVLTGANLTNADLTGADLAETDLRHIRGRETIRGLDRALHVEQAKFND
jgi:uncharacterized protein YjbI with pentapeptide repeats